MGRTSNHHKIGKRRDSVSDCRRTGEASAFRLRQRGAWNNGTDEALSVGTSPSGQRFPFAVPLRKVAPGADIGLMDYRGRP